MVRNGADVFISPDGVMCATAQEAIEWRKGRLHTSLVVYREMMLQVMKEYSCLPDPQRMPLHHIVFFYEGCRHTLRHATKST